ncbi:MAG: hypothetical protein K6B71_02480 [Alphaproteobacteria bacterium]|nr:hypothetical protein [Alphaproteobacteria bacterium]
MFDDVIVVSSATSAFNNAALVTPAFFWNALLCSPLFVGIYLLGKSFIAKMGFGKYVSVENVSFWVVVITAIWVVLMGGNYGVLRDKVSLLPWVTAMILFVASIFVGIKTRNVKIPVWYGGADASNKRKWLVNILSGLVILLPVALSDTLNWWGPVLQVCAVLVGLGLGRYTSRQMRILPSSLLVMWATVVGLLMQPEYFRFAQLGNLTLIHLLWVLLTGFFAVATVMVYMVNPRNRVHQSAYVKLKWLLRFTTLFGVVLFALTEAVPVFLFAVFSVTLLFGLSVWHSESKKSGVVDGLFAWTVTLFGVLINVPTVTAMGILLLAMHPFKLRDAKYLL